MEWWVWSRALKWEVYIDASKVGMGVKLEVGVASPPPPAGISGAAQMIGDLVTGRVAESIGQAFNMPYDEGDGAGKFQFLSEVLRWRAQTQPENMLFSLLDNKVGESSTCLEWFQNSHESGGLVMSHCLIAPPLASGPSLQVHHVPNPSQASRACGRLHHGQAPP